MIRIYCFLDCEFTTEKPIELISIGAVILDEKLKETDEFYSLVRPKTASISKFCQNLTHITEEEVEQANEFHTVINSFEKFLMKYNIRIMFVWGNFDYTGLKSTIQENEYKGEFSKYLKKVKNIQPKICRITNDIYKNPSWSLKNMKYMYGLEQTVAHNALEDARDLSKIFQLYKTKEPYRERIIELGIEKRKKEIFYENKNIEVLKDSIFELFVKIGRKKLKLIKLNNELEVTKERLSDLELKFKEIKERAK